MKLFLIGNPGSFSRSINDLLSSDFDTEIHYVDKKDKITSNIKKIRDKLIKNKERYNFLVYLSGETRDKSLMKRFNKDLLIEISKICSSYHINLIYMSSLSVFGIPKTKLVSKKSIRAPISLYGNTKNSADNYFKTRKNNILIFNFLPGSLIIPNSKRGFYHKLKKFMQKKIIKIFFFLICPGGQFIFCDTEEIASEIKRVIIFSRTFLEKNSQNKNLYFEKIIARSIQVKDIFYDSNGFYPFYTLPNINLQLIKIIFSFLKPLILLRIIYLFSKVEFKSEYLDF